MRYLRDKLRTFAREQHKLDAVVPTGSSSSFLRSLFATPSPEARAAASARAALLASHISALDAFCDLRDRVFRVRSGSSDGLDILLRYLSALVLLLPRVNAADDANSSSSLLRFRFPWWDAFVDPATASIEPTTATGSIRYEMACVCFNIAASLAQIGCADAAAAATRLSAGKRFVAAAAWLGVAASHVSAASVSPSRDLSPPVLAALQQLLLGNAQRVTLHIATERRMSPATLAKVAAGASSLFLSFSDAAASSRLLPRLFIARASNVSKRMRAIAEWRSLPGDPETYDGRDGTGEGYGREIVARLKRAERWALEGSGGRRRDDDTSLVRAVQSALRAAVDRNNNVFMDVVPSTSELADVPSKILVKIPDADATASEALAAVATSNAALAKIPTTDERADARAQARAVDGMRKKAEAAIAKARAGLRGRDLPEKAREEKEEEGEESRIAGKETTDSGRAAAVESLLARVDVIEALRQHVRTDMNHARRLLLEENDADDRMRRVHGPRWTRVPSTRLATSYRDDLERFERALGEAAEADREVRKRLVEAGQEEEVGGTKEAEEAASKRSTTNTTTAPAALLRGLDAFDATVRKIEASLASPSNADALRELLDEALPKALRDVEDADDAWERTKTDASRLVARRRAESSRKRGRVAAVARDVVAAESFWQSLREHAAELLRSVRDFKMTREIEAKELEEELREIDAAGSRRRADGTAAAATTKEEASHPPPVPRGLEPAVASLQMMGFTDVRSNVRALQATDGDVQRAVAKLLSEGG